MAKQKLLYRNYKGVVATRTVEVMGYKHDTSEYHGTKPVHLMTVWDYDKEEFRDFAVKDIIEWL